jgi:hypothetical protein
MPSASINKRYTFICDWEGRRLTSSFFASELIPFDVLVKAAGKSTINSWKEKFNIGDEKIGIFARNISSTLLKEGLYRKAIKIVNDKNQK